MGYALQYKPFVVARRYVWQMEALRDQTFWPEIALCRLEVSVIRWLAEPREVEDDALLTRKIYGRLSDVA
jgi:hypothetical protein